MAVFWCQVLTLPSLGPDSTLIIDFPLQVITLCFALAHAVTAIEAKEVSKPVSKVGHVYGTLIRVSCNIIENNSFDSQTN